MSLIACCNGQSAFGNACNSLVSAKMEESALAGVPANIKANAARLAGVPANAKANAARLAGVLANAKANAARLAGVPADTKKFSEAFVTVL